MSPLNVALIVAIALLAAAQSTPPAQAGGVHQVGCWAERTLYGIAGSDCSNEMHCTVSESDLVPKCNLEAE